MREAGCVPVLLQGGPSPADTRVSVIEKEDPLKQPLNLESVFNRTQGRPGRAGGKWGASGGGTIARGGFCRQSRSCSRDRLMELMGRVGPQATCCLVLCGGWAAGGQGRIFRKDSREDS